MDGGRCRDQNELGQKNQKKKEAAQEVAKTNRMVFEPEQKGTWQRAIPVPITVLLGFVSKLYLLRLSKLDVVRQKI